MKIEMFMLLQYLYSMQCWQQHYTIPTPHWPAHMINRDQSFCWWFLYLQIMSLNDLTQDYPSVFVKMKTIWSTSGDLSCCSIRLCTVLLHHGAHNETKLKQTVQAWNLVCFFSPLKNGSCLPVSFKHSFLS